MSTTGFRKILHDPEDAKLDIVFVHGLNGDRTTTWEKDGILWPKDILPKDLGRARILSWGYSAKVLDFWQISGKHGLNEHSEQLVADMADKRDEVVSPFIPKCEKNTASIRGLTKGAKGDRPIIFVAHSLGGLVCKNGLVFAAGHAEPHYKSIADHTRGIIFLGTPHGGSDQVKWATRGATFAKMFNMSVDDGILKIFREGSSKLIEVDDNFMNFLRDRNESEDSELGKVKVTCFFEELPMPVIGQIVTKESAMIKGQVSRSIPADHREMSKFNSEEDTGYQRISGDLKRWANLFLKPAETQKRKQGTSISVHTNNGQVGETFRDNTFNFNTK